MSTNTVSLESSTTLMVCILIDGKEILLEVLWNEEVTKEVLMGWIHVEPKNVQALNETPFLATYAAGIIAEEKLLRRLRIGWAGQWLLLAMK